MPSRVEKKKTDTKKSVFISEPQAPQRSGEEVGKYDGGRKKSCADDAAAQCTDVQAGHWQGRQEAARVFPTHSGPCYSRARPIYNFLMKPLSIDQTNTAGPDNAH